MPAAAPPKPRVGSETPRVYTPPLRKLTEKTSLGFEVIEFAETILGVSLYPWQRWLLIHALELTPDGNFRFRRIILLVARQNGKSFLLAILVLWRMYLDGCLLTIGTAQNLDVAEEVWSQVVELAEDIPVLAERIAEQGGIVRVNGKKTFKLQTGERYKVAAASRRGGRGFAGAELVLLDELREHQSWDSWAAVTKTTQTKERAQIWGVSNAGDASSIVLRYLRTMAHQAIGNPDGLEESPEPEDDDLADADGVAIFEWSAVPGCSVTDRDGWAQANPSMGYSISERTLAGDAKTDPEWVFRTEVLCQWSDGSVEGPFPPGSWEASIDPDSEIPKGGQFVFAVDVSWDRSMAHIAVAGPRADGLTHVEVVASRAGTDWVAGWLRARAESDGLAGVTWQAKGAPVSSLTPDGDQFEGIAFIPWKDLGGACGSFYDSVRAALPTEDGEERELTRELRHRPQPVLDVAAATAATRPLTDAWVWDRKHSPVDISPLVAVTAGAWALAAIPEDETSVYEERGMVTL